MIAITRSNTLLRTVLRINALATTLCGAIAVAAARPLAAWMGLSAPWMLTAVGIVCLAFAAEVFYVATRPRIKARHGWIIFVLDCDWVLGSAVILLAGAPALNTAGRWTVGALAEVVACFAALEYLALRRGALD